VGGAQASWESPLHANSRYYTRNLAQDFAPPSTFRGLVTRRAAGHAARIAVASLLTAFILWRANPRAVAAVLAGTDLRWIAAAVLLVVADRTLMAYRWLVLLHPIDAAARPHFRAVMRLFFISTFAGTFLPASVGADLVRAGGLARLNVPAGPAIASVLMDRLLGVLSLVLVGVAALAGTGRSDLLENPGVDLALAAAAAGCALASVFVFSQRGADLALALGRRLPFARLRALAIESAGAIRAYARHHGDLANVLAGSIGVQVLRIIQAYCLGRALSIAAGPAAYFAFVPLILLIMLLPISINGIGTSQLAFVWFFALVGVPDEQAFALSVLFVALGVVGNLPGGFLVARGTIRT
jgi:uncharacterized membrane protein YbhN (UPF0104 family)